MISEKEISLINGVSPAAQAMGLGQLIKRETEGQSGSGAENVGLDKKFDELTEIYDSLAEEHANLNGKVEEMVSKIQAIEKELWG